MFALQQALQGQTDRCVGSEKYFDRLMLALMLFQIIGISSISAGYLGYLILGLNRCVSVWPGCAQE